MARSIYEEIKLHEQELIALERWVKDNFHTVPYIVQIMVVRGQIATENRVEQLKLRTYH